MNKSEEEVAPRTSERRKGKESLRGPPKQLRWAPFVSDKAVEAEKARIAERTMEDLQRQTRSKSKRTKASNGHSAPDIAVPKRVRLDRKVKNK